MKKLLLVFLVIAFLIIPGFYIALAEDKKPDKVKEGDLWHVQALKKFNFPVYKGFTLAAFKGYYRYPCKNETELIFRSPEFQKSEKCEVVELFLVTIDGEYFFPKIVLSEIGSAIFLHELSPQFGKYDWWTPVISVSLKYKKDNEEFSIYGLRLVGRYQADWDEKTNKFRRYKEERYYE